MASSGKVRLAHIIGTIITVLLVANAGAVLADDGPATDGARSGNDHGPFVIEAHEILPPGTLAASPSSKTTTAATLLDDGFEGTFPGTTWQLYHDSSAPDVDWGKSPYLTSAG